MTEIEHVVDPFWEAREATSFRFDSRVLEPSPPTVTDPPWFADDPVNGDGFIRDIPILIPLSPGSGFPWDDWVKKYQPELAKWCADRWLGSWRLLPRPSDVDALARTRRSWHALAEHVLAPARHRANGKIGLRFTRAGFGTPFFGADEQVRVSGTDVVVIRGEHLSVHPITTVRDVARAIGIEPGAPSGVYTPTTPLEPDTPLPVDPDAARFLGDWFGFGASVLEQFRHHHSRFVDEPSRLQLWPEHFDLSVETGPEAAGLRSTYGASPGDDDHALPYVYVTPWVKQSDPFWNEGTFASLSLDEFAAAPDQRGAALAFFERARAILADSTPPA